MTIRHHCNLLTRSRTHTHTHTLATNVVMLKIVHCEEGKKKKRVAQRPSLECGRGEIICQRHHHCKNVQHATMLAARVSPAATTFGFNHCLHREARARVSCSIITVHNGKTTERKTNIEGHTIHY